MKKAKLGISALFIIGIIFSAMGAIFIGIACLIFFLLKDTMESAIMFLLIFGRVGSIFLILGLIFLFIQLSKKRTIQKLLENGNYITAKITDIITNYNVYVAGRSPVIVYCEYQDINGTVHIFKSRNIYYNPDSFLQTEYVKVYVEGNNFRKYYVDIDEILPRVVVH